MNIETWERIVRIGIGAAIIGALFLFTSNWKWLGLIGFAPLITGVIGWCPVYALFWRD
jgi:hypothetical protein